MKKNFYKNNLIKTVENASFIAFIVVSFSFIFQF